MVYAKPPFGGPEVVLKYLARYTHRVAISNSRLLDFEEGVVRFRYKDYCAWQPEASDEPVGRRSSCGGSCCTCCRRGSCGSATTGSCRIAIGMRTWRCAASCSAAPRRRRSGGGGEGARGPGCRSTPTRVCPVCGAGRMVVIAEFPPTASGVEMSRGSRGAWRWTAREPEEEGSAVSAGDDRRGGGAGSPRAEGESPGSEGSRAGGEGDGESGSREGGAGRETWDRAERRPRAAGGDARGD